MQTHTPLTLLTPSGTSFTIQAIEVTVIQSEGETHECHLSFQVTLDQYQRITTDNLFHLKPELLSPIANGDLQPDVVIEMTATLQPQLLPSLTQQATASNAIIDYLAQLSQPLAEQSMEPEHSSPTNGTDATPETPIAETTTNGPTVAVPLLQTDSWFTLSVKQQQPSGEIQYRTLWSYLSPAALAQEVTSDGQISTAMGDLFQELALHDEAAIAEAFDDLFQGLGSWVDDQLSSTEETFSTLADEISQAFESWLTPDSTLESSPRPSKQPIYRAMLTFFSDDDWAFTKLRGESTLQLAFQGEHGQWTCYAVARDDQAQFLFYSIYPTTVPADYRGAIAEYLARANYGLVQGNFEFDFDSGEIRYKTNLDITHLSINTQVIQQLVYANVTIMDHYLPGILAVLEHGTDAKAALQIVEV